MESAWANRRQAHFPLAQVPRCLLPVSVMSPRWAVPPEECSKGSTPVNPMNVTAVEYPVDPAHQVGFDRGQLRVPGGQHRPIMPEGGLQPGSSSTGPLG